MLSKQKKYVLVLASISLLIGSLMSNLQVQAITGVQTNQPVKITRLGGYDRYETAALASRAGWDTAETVVLTGGNDVNMVDALTVAPLAKQKKAPILLTDSTELNIHTLNEIKRLGAKTVYVAPGIAVIPDAILKPLVDTKVKIIRLGGETRYKTALNIANEFKKTQDYTEVVISNGDNIADTLSIAPIAALKRIPILLVDKDGMVPDVENILISDKITNITIVGNSDHVSSNIEYRLPKSDRIGGKDSFETNALILDHYKNILRTDQIYISNGDPAHLIDALSGVTLAGGASPKFPRGSALVYAHKDYLTNLTATTLNTNQTLTNVTLLGGASILDNQLVSSLKPVTKVTADSSQTIVVSENAIIDGDDLNISNITFNKNLTLRGTRLNLDNIVVKGSIYIDPLSKDVIAPDDRVVDGDITSLSDVTTPNLLIKSGRLTLNDSKVKNVHIEGDKKTTLEFSGSTDISKVTVLSDTSITNNASVIDDLVIPSNKTVNLALTGESYKTITIDEATTLDTSNSTLMPSLVISDKVKGWETVKLKGNYTQINSDSNANLVFDTETTVSNLNMYKPSIVTLSEKSTVTEMTAVGGVFILGGGVVNGALTDKSTKKTLDELDSTSLMGNKILTFSFGAYNGVITEATTSTEKNTIVVTIPFGYDLTKLTPSLTTSRGAKVTPAVGAVINLTRTVNYTVTPQKGPTRMYTVSTQIDPASLSTANDITSFKFTTLNVTGILDIANHTIAITVPHNTDVRNLAPTIAVSPYVTVTPATGARKDFTNPVEYVVTAQNGTPQIWTVTVTVAP